MKLILGATQRELVRVNTVSNKANDTIAAQMETITKEREWVHRDYTKLRELAKEFTKIVR